MGEEDRVHTCTSRILEGHTVPSVVPDIRKFFCHGSSGVPVLVPVRASPVPSPVPSVVRGSFVLKFFFRLLREKKERKKENRQPKGGMGGRHAATTQGF